MKIVVSIATYNGEKYIWDQLISLHEQTLKPTQIIISDDNSSDNTLVLVEKFKQITDIPVCIIKNTVNSGYTRNFEKALCNSDGDYIFPCDQDDYWFPDKIEKMIEFANKHPNFNVYVCDVELTNSALTSLNIKKSQSLVENGLFTRHHGMGCATLLRGSFLSVCLPFPSEVKGHDNWINSIAYHSGTFIFFNECLQYYRRHTHATSNISSNNLMSLGDRFSWKRLKFLNIDRVSYENYFAAQVYARIKAHQHTGTSLFNAVSVQNYISLYKYELSIRSDQKFGLTKFFKIFLWCFVYYPKFSCVVNDENISFKERIKHLVNMVKSNAKT